MFGGGVWDLRVRWNYNLWIDFNIKITMASINHVQHIADALDTPNISSICKYMNIKRFCRELFHCDL